MPRSRDKYAGSAHGGVAPRFGPHVAIGEQAGHVRPEDVIPPQFESYMRKQQGEYTIKKPFAHLAIIAGRHSRSMDSHALSAIPH